MSLQFSKELFYHETEKKKEKEKNSDAITNLCWPDLQKHCLHWNERKLIADQGREVTR